MARWEPDAAGRLHRAALELFAERGYEATTVADIAARAGLTKRTFFRHFADKREVLFAGSAMADAYAAAIDAAPADEPVTEVLKRALTAAAGLVDERGTLGRQRYAIVAANPELAEREAMKRVVTAEIIAAALCRRGMAPTPAALAAETVVGVFKTAYADWGSGRSRERLATLVVDYLDLSARVVRDDVRADRG